MNFDKILTNIEHPHALGSFRNWYKLLRNSEKIEYRYFPRVLFVFLSTLLTSPLRFYENVRYKEALQSVQIHPEPIFIIGHWRTGSSHLHNILCQDPNLGYMSTFNAMAPGFSLLGDGWIKPILNWLTQQIHPTRIIDNMPLSLDTPQEDDYAISNASPYSFLHLFTFPQQASFFVNRYALLKYLSQEEIDDWKQTYIDILKKTTLLNFGKRLVLKSPANSGRLPEILNLFPNAKFIHLMRNPYDVFLSMQNLYNKVLPRTQVQSINADEIDENIISFYSQLMAKFLEEKSLIPKENFVEVKFERLESQPLEQLNIAYTCLDLPGYAAAEPKFCAYLESVKDYKKNTYNLDFDVISKVNRHWDFAFDEWEYVRL